MGMMRASFSARALVPAIFVAAAFAAIVALEGAAHAQEADSTMDFELFRPQSDFYGYLHSPSAATLQHLQVSGGFWMNLENDPVILVNNGNRFSPRGVVTGDQGDAVVESRFTGNAQFGIGLSRYFSLTVDVPLIFFQDGYELNRFIDDPRNSPTELNPSAVGDVRVQPRLVALDRDRHPIGLSLAMPVGLPTGNGGSFLGEEALTLTPMGVLELSNGSIHKREYTFRMAFTGGYRVREESQLRDVRFGNEAVYGVALGFHPVQEFELMGEFHGTVGGTVAAQKPAEVLGGAKLHFGDMIVLHAGGGAGVIPGVGAPDWRVIFGLSVGPNFDPNARDRDKDGIVDGMDQCKRDPEDPDGWQDEDGCPEADNDLDGILDIYDGCPNEAEDQDGHLDADGCPDAENDMDAILDVADRCPDEAETENGYQDEDGCPDEAPAADTDGDGYDDDVDRCPYDAEDFDNFEDEDGCPEADNDGDGLEDIVDQCPMVREVYNGVDDTDGCPDEGRVVIENNFIRILDKIYFEFGRAEIQEVSFSLLDELAATILANPQILKIRVEGHTDNVGDELYNLKLSQSRARAVVDALVSRDIAEARLTSAGFGEQQPIVDNDTEESRARNRRVEFIIVSQE
jgi:outer membrane protein OmpA-like peptidoglycan-associated protein